MDSDSSHDGDRRNDCKRRDWENRQNSDVSDDENFSRGAKSIDSPPESPPRGGGNLDSPPASPAQGVESPHSVYSGSRRSSGSSDGTGDYGPQSPASLHPKSPESPDHDDSHSRGRGRSQGSDRDHSHDRALSLSPKSRSVSPEVVNSRNARSDSQSPRSHSRQDRYGSPETMGSQGRMSSRGPASPDEVKNFSRENSSSPQWRRDDSSDRSPSPSESQIKNRDVTSSPVRRGAKSPDEYSRSPDHSRSNSPFNRDSDRYPPEKTSRIVSPDNRSPRRQSDDWDRSPNTSGTPNKITSPSRRSRGSHSSSNSRSPSRVRSDNRNIRSPVNAASPDRDARSRSLEDREESRSSRRSHLRRRGSDESRGSSRSRKSNRNRKGNGHNHERHKSLKYGPGSPDSDGPSNISSNSSLGSPVSNKSRSLEPKRGSKPMKMEIKSHGEDLSDVSDIESIGSVSDEDHKQKEAKKNDKEKEEKEKKNGMNIEEAEQLDFEAEESESPAKKAKDKDKEKEKENDNNDSDEEGEVKELEEGELSDEGEVRPEETEPRPVCRFFSRGQCTWGSSCSFRHPDALLPLPRPRFPRPFLTIRGRGIPFPIRIFNPRFVHPGVTDKGNYTMFDMVRPLVPMNAGPPPPHMYPPMDCYRPPIERPPMMGPPPYQQPIIRREEPPGESAWERGLRQAKEMLRRSTKRKETDADFEEKKMTLSLSGQEEFDKENDYYPRPSSPIYDEYHDRTKEGDKRYRSVSDRFGDYPPPANYYRDGWYDDRPPHYHRSSRHHSGSGGYGGRGAPDDYYESRKKKYSSREVTVQRGEKGWKDSSPPSTRSRGGRGDEWADPWMRSKSPSRKGAARKKSYSSRSRSSSYSSSSSSRSSSYSSYSRSRSSLSRSGSSRSRSRSSFSRKKLSPLSRRAKSPFSRDRRVGEADRGLHMNPPPPSPRGLSPRRNPTPPPQTDRVNRNISARLLAAAMRDRSVSSRSSSGSESSGSSSDSSSESGSSSSSSSPVRHKPSLQNRKKLEFDEKLAQAVKAKAMDALKLSGQKQQIKLTLKGTGSSLSERVAAPATRKRPAPDSPNSGDDSSPNVSKKKNAPSRREELLKQLKAVEDAIARKRSKV